MRPAVLGTVLKFSDRDVQLSFPVQEIISAGSKHFVLIDGSEMPAGEHLRNIYCFDENGQQLWRNKPLPWNDIDRVDTWCKIWLSDSGRLMARTYSEIELEIDMGTGNWIPGKPSS